MLAILFFSGRSTHQSAVQLGQRFGFRHVSADSSHRDRKPLETALKFFLIALWGWVAISPIAHAEANRQGAMVRVLGEAALYRDAARTARKFGYLPPGTLVTLKGERRDDFLGVEVELEEGNVEGWILAGNLDLGDEEAAEGKSDAMAKNRARAKDKPKLSRRRMVVPEDEGLLIRRDPTFLYGLHGGGLYSMIQDADANLYNGIGYGGGAHFGIFLTPNIPLRLEVTYNALKTAAADGGTVKAGSVVDVNYLDTSAVLQYWYQGFELSLAATYGFAVGVSNVPTNIKFGDVSELSSFWTSVGAGYRIELAPQIYLALRGKYSLSFLSSPISLQTIGFQVALDFAG